jgi:hypothetical protein
VLRSILDFVELVSLARSVENERVSVGPGILVARLRRRGTGCLRRGTIDRARLQRLIRVVDRLFSSGPNCYRRALLEIAMDAGAAKERLEVGLALTHESARGHAWLESSSDTGGGYQVQLSL